VLSIDISQAFLRLARQRHPRLQVVASDVSSLALAGGSLDCIVSLSTLDHFRHESQIEAALGELHGCLKPGGRLLITMDNLSNPAVWLRNRLPQHWLRRLGIVPLFVGVACTSGRLHRLLTRAGFRVFRIRARLHCPRVLAVAVCRVAAALNFRPLNQAVLWLLAAFEVLDRVPTRFLTGYFIAVLAVKPDGTQEGNPSVSGTGLSLDTQARGGGSARGFWGCRVVQPVQRFNWCRAAARRHPGWGRRRVYRVPT
ncbi:MAG: class I SAM-dependent methyltransferase, partial [Acidobacteria bacterium]|nr:class I SAM-dependent methyltransferase [Acidobacteriota bacterium]